MNKQTILSQLDRSYKKLLEALEFPETHPLAIDGTIHRFESTYEIACETVNQFFRENRLPGRSSHKTLKAALNEGLIDNGETWQNLMLLKDQTSYSFSEILAKDIYESIRRDHHIFSKLITHCRNMEPAGWRSDRPKGHTTG